MNKIYILGGNGYIGSHFRKYFSGSDKLIPINYNSKKQGFTINEFLSANFKINENDKIFDCSWFKPTDYENNYHLTISMLQKRNEYDILIQKGAKNFFICGTCLEYGLQVGEMTHKSCLFPVVPYAIAKVLLFYYLQNQVNKIGGALTWFRLFYIYGGDRKIRSLYSEALKSKKNKIMTTGDLSRRRDFVHIKDCCNQMQKIINENEVGIYNICSGKNLRIDEFIAMITNSKIEDWNFCENKKFNLWFEPEDFHGKRTI